jgi:transposase
MSFLKYGIGLDVGMSTFDACISLINTQQEVIIQSSKEFTNSSKGFTELMKWVNKVCKLELPRLYLMEATGVYHEQLAWYLYDQELNLSIVLPNKARKYKESLGLKSKNDKIDAKGLAQMACERQWTLWNPLSRNIYFLRIVTRKIEKLSQQITVAKNQLHALEKGMFRDKAVEKMCSRQIRVLEKDKISLQGRVQQLIESDKDLHRKVTQICQIKGLGLQIVAIILAETNAFASFENIAQLVSYSGYDVVENSSGSRIGKTRISKKGNSHIRRSLHFAALNVIKYQVKPFKNLYNRIYEKSKIKMKGYTAVQKKLLAMIYVLWKKDEPFDPEYQGETSRDGEVKSSFASAQPQEQTTIIKQEEKKKITPDEARVTQDKHPSKCRRMSSFA